MKWFVGMAFATFIAISAIAHAQNYQSYITADVQKLANDWMNAYNKKDAATIANMYTNDGILSNPGWTASGRTAIEDALNKEFALGIFKYTSITVDQAQRIGDMTYSRGTDDDERLSPIGLHDQHVAIVEPAIQFPKAV